MKFAKTHQYYGPAPEGEILFLASNLNCKHYALSILSELGIDISELSDTFFKDPLKDIHKMEQLSFEDFSINPKSNSALGLLARIRKLSKNINLHSPDALQKIQALHNLREKTLQNLKQHTSKEDPFPSIDHHLMNDIQEIQALNLISIEESSFLYDKTVHHQTLTEFHWTHTPRLSEISPLASPEDQEILNLQRLQKNLNNAMQDLLIVLNEFSEKPSPDVKEKQELLALRDSLEEKQKTFKKLSNEILNNPVKLTDFIENLKLELQELDIQTPPVSAFRIFIIRCFAFVRNDYKIQLAQLNAYQKIEGYHQALNKPH